eukprot:SAG31_NODE_2090_length_6472_cov_4.683352_1_plen_146_part_00
MSQVVVSMGFDERLVRKVQAWRYEGCNMYYTDPNMLYENVAARAPPPQDFGPAPAPEPQGTATATGWPAAGHSHRRTQPLTPQEQRLHLGTFCNLTDEQRLQVSPQRCTHALPRIQNRGTRSIINHTKFGVPKLSPGQRTPSKIV